MPRSRSITYQTYLQQAERLERLTDLQWRLLVEDVVCYDLADKIAALTSTPVAVQCRICRLRFRNYPGIVPLETPPLCEQCEKAACARFGCYLPATVAIELHQSTVTLCEGHGLLLFRDCAGVTGLVIRHLPDGARRRAAYGHRLLRRKVPVAA